MSRNKRKKFSFSMQVHCLVLAEQKHGKLQPSTLHTISAAGQLGGPVDVLVAGSDVKDVAQCVSNVEGVANVLLADHSSLNHNLAEPTAALVREVQKRCVSSCTNESLKQ